MEGSQGVGVEGEPVTLTISVPYSDSHGGWSEGMRKGQERWRPLKACGGELPGGQSQRRATAALRIAPASGSEGKEGPIDRHGELKSIRGIHGLDRDQHIGGASCQQTAELTDAAHVSRRGAGTHSQSMKGAGWKGPPVNGSEEWTCSPENLRMTGVRPASGLGGRQLGQGKCWPVRPRVKHTQVDGSHCQ